MRGERYVHDDAHHDSVVEAIAHEGQALSVPAVLDSGDGYEDAVAAPESTRERRRPLAERASLRAGRGPTRIGAPTRPLEPAQRHRQVCSVRHARGQNRSSGSRTILTGSAALRDERPDAAVFSASANSAPCPRDTRTSIRSVSPPLGDRADDLRAVGQGRRCQQFGNRRAGRRSATPSGPPAAKPSSTRSASSRAASAGRIPAHEGLDRRHRGIGPHDDLAARPDERGRVHPAPQRLLPRPQVGAGQQGPAVEQQGGAVTAAGRPARRPGSRPPAPARPSTVDSTRSPPLVRTVTPGKARPNSSAVRPAPTTTARSRRPPHFGQRPVAGRAGRTSGRRRSRRAPPRRAGRSSRRTGRACGRAHRPATARSRAAAPAPAPAARPPAPRRWSATPGYGSRAAAAAGSRASSTSSPVAATRGAAARSTARSATISCAHRIRPAAGPRRVRA